VPKSGSSPLARTIEIKSVMKQLILGMMLGAALLTRCASHYVITLTNGYRIVAAGKPKLDTEHLAFVYKDLNGQTNSVPSVSVRAIVPASSQPPAK
jgi:hypothetical protein